MQSQKPYELFGGLHVSKVIQIKTPEHKMLIIQSLVYSENLGGRGLTEAIPAFSLPVGARLEPSPELLDIADFETLELPCIVIFWVNERRLIHESPLVRIPGVGHDSWRIDLLHAWQLGPLERYVGASFNLFLNSGVFFPNSSYLDKTEKKDWHCFTLRVCSCIIAKRLSLIHI